MAMGANMKPALADLMPHIAVMFDLPNIQAPKAPLPLKYPETPYGEHVQVATGLADYVSLFESTPPPAPAEKSPHPYIMRYRQKEERRFAYRELIRSIDRDWEPRNNPKATTDGYATMFLAHLSELTTEETIRSMLEPYGEVKEVKLIKDLNGKSCRYAFAEFSKEDDMTSAIKGLQGGVYGGAHAHPVTLDGRHILLDVERGRTVQSWRPLKLGGGKGAVAKPRSKASVYKERQEHFYTTREDIFMRFRTRQAAIARGEEMEEERGREASGDRDGYRGGRDRSDRDYRDRDRDRDRDRGPREGHRERGAVYGDRRRGEDRRDDRDGGGYYGRSGGAEKRSREYDDRGSGYEARRRRY